jgi:hypothetical protein
MPHPQGAAKLGSKSRRPRVGMSSPRGLGPAPPLQGPSSSGRMSVAALPSRASQPQPRSPRGGAGEGEPHNPLPSTATGGTAIELQPSRSLQLDDGDRCNLASPQMSPQVGALAPLCLCCLPACLLSKRGFKKGF